MLKIINYIALFLSVAWLVSAKDWEPAIVMLMLLASLFSLYQSQVKVTDLELSKQKIYTVSALILLTLALIISKPSESAHRGAMFKIEKVVAKNSNGKGLKSSEVSAMIFSSAYLSAMKENGDIKTVEDERITFSLLKTLYSEKFQKYYDFKILSYATSFYEQSIGALGYILVLKKESKDFIIITSTQGEIYYKAKASTYTAELIEQFIKNEPNK